MKISKWPNLVNLHPIWFKLGMEVIYDPLNGKLPLKVAAAIFFLPTGSKDQNQHIGKNFQLRYFSSDFDEIWLRG